MVEQSTKLDKNITRRSCDLTSDTVSGGKDTFLVPIYDQSFLDVFTIYKRVLLDGTNAQTNNTKKQKKKTKKKHFSCANV